jgi:hypothetical protein
MRQCQEVRSGLQDGTCKGIESVTTCKGRERLTCKGKGERHSPQGNREYHSPREGTSEIATAKIFKAKALVYIIKTS